MDTVEFKIVLIDDMGIEITSPSSGDKLTYNFDVNIKSRIISADLDEGADIDIILLNSTKPKDAKELDFFKGGFSSSRQNYNAFSKGNARVSMFDNKNGKSNLKAYLYIGDDPEVKALNELEVNVVPALLGIESPKKDEIFIVQDGSSTTVEFKSRYDTTVLLGGKRIACLFYKSNSKNPFLEWMARIDPEGKVDCNKIAVASDSIGKYRFVIEVMGIDPNNSSLEQLVEHEFTVEEGTFNFEKH